MWQFNVLMFLLTGSNHFGVKIKDDSRKQSAERYAIITWRPYVFMYEIIIIEDNKIFSFLHLTFCFMCLVEN